MRMLILPIGAVLTCAVMTIMANLEACKSAALLNLPESLRNFSSTASGAGAGLLGSEEAWTPRRSRIGEWLSLDLGAEQLVLGAEVEGGTEAEEWVKMYKVQYATSSSDWLFVPGSFVGNSDRDTRASSRFPQRIRARYVRVFPITWNGEKISMRAGLTVCKVTAPEQTLMISSAMNNDYPEPWSTWVPRYFMWHVLVLSMTSFKRRALPEEAWWVPDLTAAAVLVMIWSGYQQTDVTIATLKVPAAVKNGVHDVAAFCFFVTIAFETVMVWWPKRFVVVPYFAAVAAFVGAFCVQKLHLVHVYDSGIPFVHTRWEVLLEWLLVGAHFPIVWWRFPAVEAEMKTGIWKPWFGMPSAGLHLDARLRREREREASAREEDEGHPVRGSALLA